SKHLARTQHELRTGDVRNGTEYPIMHIEFGLGGATRADTYETQEARSTPTRRYRAGDGAASPRSPPSCLHPPYRVRRPKTQRLAPPHETHPHPVLRAQRHQGIELHRVQRIVHEAPLLRDGGKHEHSLHPRELLPNAHPRPGAKREVRELRTHGHALGEPALRVESRGVL